MQAAGMKRLLRDWIPPALLRALRPVPQVVTFEGDYPSWQEALAEATGYDSDEILRRVAASTRKILRGEARFERDSVCFDHIEYAWPMLASLMLVASRCGSLRVIDIGGSLGSSYRQNLSFLKHLNIPVSWRIVEQAAFVALGKAEFSEGVLGFDADVADAGQSGCDVALFASSLCYLEDPARFLGEIEDLGVPYLIIDRLPVTPSERDIIRLQRVREPIYPASYPVRIFNEQNLLQNWLKEWRLVEAWDCELQFAEPGPRNRGYFLELKRQVSR